MPTVYHRDDPGAPALTFGTTYASQFPAFKTILKACLVTGYSGKTAAGWTLVAEGTNYIVLRNGPGKGYVCFTWSAGQYITVYVAQTYTGIVNDVITGDGVKTGLASAATVPHRLGINLLVYNTGACTWYMVADAKTFIFQGVGNNGNTAFDGTSTNSIPLYVGEDDAGNFIAMGGLNSTATLIDNYFSAAGMTSLKDPATGLLVDTGSLAAYTPALVLPGTGKQAPAVVALPKVPLCQVPWVGGGVLAGNLRGMVLSPPLLLLNADVAAKYVGLSGMSTRTANTPIDLGGGFSYFISATQTACALRLVTNNPEFW